jgi:hypothetical protein
MNSIKEPLVWIAFSYGLLCMELIRFEQKFNVSKKKPKPPKGPAIDKIYKSGAHFY